MPKKTHPTLLASPGSGGDELSTELEQRLRAAMTVMTIPLPLPAGQMYTPPPTGRVAPEVEGQRQIALIRWKTEAQRLLDRCVSRPEALRQQVVLTVLFAPPPNGTEYLPQQLSPVVISVPVNELRRLWHDTAPDALQGCIDRIRALALTVPPARNAPAQALPASAASVLVKL